VATPNLKIISIVLEQAKLHQAQSLLVQ